MDSGVYNIRLTGWKNLIYEANISGMKKVDGAGCTESRQNSSITGRKK